MDRLYGGQSGDRGRRHLAPGIRTGVVGGLRGRARSRSRLGTVDGWRDGRTVSRDPLRFCADHAVWNRAIVNVSETPPPKPGIRSVARFTEFDLAFVSCLVPRACAAGMIPAAHLRV